MSDTREAIVETGSGKLEGEFKDGLYQFKGIPYAAAPIGPRRWLPPEPAEPWVDIRPAKEFGNIAPQIVPPTIFAGLATEGSQDEDCLFLNVCTPGLDDKKRPVLVWIHGGAFNMGASSQVAYDGSKLSTRGDVVVASINYRLGPLGFLNLTEVTGGRIPATGNEGLLDQIAALAWIKENIAAFGGNPENITVFGESAGAMSIGCLLVMPEAQGLFDKAILQSGVANTAMPKDGAVMVSRLFLDALGVEPNDVKAIRDASPEQLLEADLKVRTKLAGPGEVIRPTVTAPVIDGIFIPDTPLDLLISGKGAKVPVIIGTNRDEWFLFASMSPSFPHMDEEGLKERINTFIPSTYSPRMIDIYRKARQTRNEQVRPLDLANALLSDLMFRIPAIDVLDGMNDLGVPAFCYMFNWPSPAMGGLLGACHALEIGFVFNKLEPDFNGDGQDAEWLSHIMQDGWLAFARSGNPSCASIGTWPFYGVTRSTMMFGKSCCLELAPLEDERKAWEPLGRGVTKSKGPESLP
jgi:para-nitrobenzyl esterase